MINFQTHLNICLMIANKFLNFPDTQKILKKTIPSFLSIILVY